MGPAANRFKAWQKPAQRPYNPVMERRFTSHQLQQAKADPSAPPGDEPSDPEVAKTGALPAKKPKEIGGPSGPEPTRYGDWERNGICYDF